MALPGAASRRRSEGAGVHGRADGLHLQRDVRRRAARRRALHRRAGQRLLVVPLARARRTHEPLRPRHVADGRLRLQAEDHRRPRVRLADRLRRHGAVLRQGRALHRRDRHAGGNPQRAGRHLQPAGAAPRPRRPDPAVLREARHPGRRRPSGGHDGGAQRPPGVPLLRPVRPRLPDGLELRRELRADFPGDGDRARQGPRELDGARADHRRHRQGHAPSPTSTRRPAPRSRCAAAPSSWRPAPASRRACC